jgi:hypothetical protein
MHEWGTALCQLCHFSFKRVQQWPSVPTASISCCFSTNDCVYGKKTGHFCSQFRQEKSIFECTIGARRFVSCVVFPSNEFNNGHPYLQKVFLVVLVRMIVYMAKRLVILAHNFAKKSPFLNA